MKFYANCYEGNIRVTISQSECSAAGKLAELPTEQRTNKNRNMECNILRQCRSSRTWNGAYVSYSYDRGRLANSANLPNISGAPGITVPRVFVKFSDGERAFNNDALCIFQRACNQLLLNITIG